MVPEAFRSRTTSRKNSWLTGSRPEKGSSRIASAGRWRTAAMNWTRCWLPLESASSRSCLRSSSPIRSSHSQARRVLSRRSSPRSRPRDTSDRQDRDLLVKTAVLGQIARPVGMQPTARGALARNVDVSLVGPDDADEHPNGRRLAGAVWAQQGEDLAPADLEAEPLCGDVDRRSAWRRRAREPTPRPSRSPVQVGPDVPACVRPAAWPLADRMLYS